VAFGAHLDCQARADTPTSDHYQAHTPDLDFRLLDGRPNHPPAGHLDPLSDADAMIVPCASVVKPAWFSYN
jgi:hypothetical protein